MRQSMIATYGPIGGPWLMQLHGMLSGARRRQDWVRLAELLHLYQTVKAACPL